MASSGVGGSSSYIEDEPIIRDRCDDFCDDLSEDDKHHNLIFNVPTSSTHNWGLDKGSLSENIDNNGK